MEKEVKQKVDLIAQCVFSKIQKTHEDHYGLYSGMFIEKANEILTGSVILIRPKKNINKISVSSSSAN